MQRQRSGFAFGPYRLVPDRQLLLRGHSQVPLGGRTFDILHLLVQRAGELVSKEALVEFAWPGTAVSDSNLRVQVRKLRRALGDVRGQPIYIASIARRGYRFVPDVSVESEFLEDGSGTRIGMHTLPASRPIVGRAEEIASIVTAVGHGGLVTVVGPAGVGKTTVAVAAARFTQAKLSEPSCFVDLSRLAIGSPVAHLLAKALGLPPPTGEIASAIVDHLRDRRILVVLDQCEHVLPAVASLAAAITEVGVKACLLATSRQPLGLRGEVVSRMNPLGCPHPSQVTGMREALAFPAVAFFALRAHEYSGRTFKDVDAVAVTALCRALDGIPLALELAAAKLQTMGVAEILASVEGRSELLESDR